MRRSMRLILCVLILATGVLACEGTVEPEAFTEPDPSGDPAADGVTTLSLHLTDAPGDVEAVWVDIEEVYFQGGPGGRLTLLDERTGLIELTSLVDVTEELARGLEVDPGLYQQLRMVLAGAVLETEGGEVYVFGNASHPEELATTGNLACPSCSQSGLKVKLGGGAFEVEEGGNALVMDFDVGQSFTKQLGQSGTWMMSPVIHGTRSDDAPEDVEDGEDPEGEPDEGGEIQGTVRLATDEGGDPLVEIPACPAGTPRSLEDFVPTATANTLSDEDGGPIVRTGEVDEDGTFEIDYLDPDVYTMGYWADVTFEDHHLVFEATVALGQATVTAEQNAEDVVYTVTSASCEGPEEEPSGSDKSTLSLHLTDAPGVMSAVWVSIAEVYFQGGPGGRLPILTVPTEPIELTALVRGITEELIGDLEVEPGMYRQLRLVLAGAVLVTEGGDVYVFGNGEHPEGLEATGELKCPSCSASGLKVKLGGGEYEVEEGDNTLVMDFDVAQSFGKPAGNSGKWTMTPTIFGTRGGGDSEEGEESEEGSDEAGKIEGRVQLATDEAGEPVVEIPACLDGTVRSLEDFVPTASANTLLDDEGGAIMRTGEVGEDGAFEINNLAPDTYTMGFLSEIPLEGYRLLFEATVEPAEATVGADASTDGVVYTITAATCEADPQ